VFWTGGRHGYGHVALSRGNGSVWSTDYHRVGKVDACRIDEITRDWGLRLVGWTEDINGVRVWQQAEPKRKAPARPTRVQKARAKLAEALELLDASVRNGRTGWVRIGRDQIREGVDRLPRK
jgi:hypothetical protein